MLEVKKAHGYGRSKPVSVPAVLIGEPATPAKQRFRTRQVDLVIDAIGRDVLTELQPFLERALSNRNNAS